ncbi:MAG: PPC domain-containing protein [Deltaproteobacteria bacterium]
MRAVVLVLLIGCADHTDKTAACHLSTAHQNATVQDRKVIGGAAEYTPDLGLPDRDAELQGSIAARRAVAWQVVGKVLAPVTMAEPTLSQPFQLPAWGTWFTRDDFDRVFKKLYRDFTPAQRHARAPLDAATIDAGFQWNTTALDELSADWPAQRYADYVAAIDSQDKADGIAGANRVGYSPGAMRQLIHSYVQQDACRTAPEPAPFAPDATKPGAPVNALEVANLDECDWQAFGPYDAGDGEVTITLSGDGDADLYVRTYAAPDATTYDCKSDGDSSNETCTVPGGAPIYVGVFGAKPSAVKVNVAYTTLDVASPTCLDGPQPRDAVIVKADWHRDLGEGLPIFDTSAARMTQRLSASASLWTDDGGANPGPTQIYTATLPGTGATFRMPGMHIMSKELDHWLWITLWWSPDPDSDFGADRPAAIAALPGPWKNYKMCVTAGYVENDPDPRGGFDGTLGDSLAAVSAARGGQGGPSWCSNPYIELGDGNAATNCIGCHQHGGTELLPEAILSDEPHFGSTRVRNNFFTDYTWAIKGGRGEDLSSIVQAEVDYWDANDPP